MDRLLSVVAALVALAAAPAGRAQVGALPEIAGAASVAVPGVGVILGGYLFQPPVRRPPMPALLLLHDNPGSAEDLESAARNLAERGSGAPGVRRVGCACAAGE